MTDLVILKQSGRVIRDDTDPLLPPSTMSTLDGAKALQGLKCSCGGIAEGLSGWVRNTLKMRIMCHKCFLDFYIERTINENQFDTYINQHHAQQIIERDFLRQYSTVLLSTNKTPKMGQLLQFKPKNKVIELDKSMEIDYTEEDEIS